MNSLDGSEASKVKLTLAVKYFLLSILKKYMLWLVKYGSCISIIAKKEKKGMGWNWPDRFI